MLLIALEEQLDGPLRLPRQLGAGDFHSPWKSPASHPEFALPEIPPPLPLPRPLNFWKGVWAPPYDHFFSIIFELLGDVSLNNACIAQDHPAKLPPILAMFVVYLSVVVCGLRFVSPSASASRDGPNCRYCVIISLFIDHRQRGPWVIWV
jgi:hypothetical protein